MASERRLSHVDLVKLASKWLANVKRCGVNIAEIVTAAGEIPDVIGWKYGRSIVVECKTSRADFLRDKDKGHNRNGDAMGMQRYFLAPKGIIKVEELDSETGLIEVNIPEELCSTSLAGKPYLRVTREAESKERPASNYINELQLLTSALRRIKTREFITILEQDAAADTPKKEG